MYLCFFDRRTKEQIISQQKQVKRLLSQGKNLLNPCNHVDKNLCTYVLLSEKKKRTNYFSTETG